MIPEKATARCHNYFEYVMISIILLLFLRIPIVVISGYPQHLNKFIFLFLLSAIIVVVFKRSPIRMVFRSNNLIKTSLLINASLLLIFSVINLFPYSLSYSLNMLKTVASANGMFLLLLFFLDIDISLKRLTSFFHKLSILIVLLTSVPYIIEWFCKWQEITTLAFWGAIYLKGLPYSFSNGTTTHDIAHIIGVMGQPHYTPGIIAACTNFLVAHKIINRNNIKSLNKRNVLELVTIILGIVTMIITERVFPIVAFLFTLFITLHLVFKSKKLLLLTILGTCVLFAFSNAVQRVENYLNLPHEMLPFIPKIENCNISFLWSPAPQGCTIGEFHILTNAKYYGLWIFIPFLLVTFYILFQLFQYLKLKGDIKHLSAILFCLSIGISSLHYNVVGAWGINVMTMLALWIIYKQFNTLESIKLKKNT